MLFTNSIFKKKMSKKIQSIDGQHLVEFLSKNFEIRTKLEAGQFLNTTPSNNPCVQTLLRKLDNISSRTCGCSAEMRIDQRKPWSLSNYYHGAAAFLTLTSNYSWSAVFNYIFTITEKKKTKYLDFDYMLNDGNVHDPESCYEYFQKLKNYS